MSVSRQGGAKLEIIRKGEASRFLVVASFAAALWFAVSYVLILWLAAAEDNPDMAAPVPTWLRLACGVACFPLRPKVGLLVDSLLWGVLLSFAYVMSVRFVMRIIRRRGASPGGISSRTSDDPSSKAP